MKQSHGFMIFIHIRYSLFLEAVSIQLESVGTQLTVPSRDMMSRLESSMALTDRGISIYGHIKDEDTYSYLHIWA